jgi:hypothetical protein
MVEVPSCFLIFISKFLFFRLTMSEATGYLGFKAGLADAKP